MARQDRIIAHRKRRRRDSPAFRGHFFQGRKRGASSFCRFAYIADNDAAWPRMIGRILPRSPRPRLVQLLLNHTIRPDPASPISMALTRDWRATSSGLKMLRVAPCRQQRLVHRRAIGSLFQLNAQSTCAPWQDGVVNSKYSSPVLDRLRLRRRIGWRGTQAASADNVYRGLVPDIRFSVSVFGDFEFIIAFLRGIYSRLRSQNIPMAVLTPLRFLPLWEYSSRDRHPTTGITCAII